MGYPMTYENPAKIMEEVASLVPSYSGVLYPDLEKGGIQWFSTNGKKGKFSAVAYKGPMEQPDGRYPLWIIPRGFHFHYGIGTTTKRAKGLAKVLPDTCLEIHPRDALKGGLNSGDRVKIISPRGEVETTCKISEAVPIGVAYFATTFFPVFVNNLLMSGQEAAGQHPEYKAFVGRLEKR